MSMISRRNVMLATAATTLAAQTAPPRKSRANSFFGIHFDLHPKPTDKELGKDISEANINRFLAAVSPDYVQYDCKGHVGWLGYPSSVSKSAPGIVQDSLAIWRDLTEKSGVALYIHFSGVWDSLAITEHPEYARVRPDQSKDDRQTSLWSRYAEDRMIPQLLEASAKYRLDGVWVDGECWITSPDYSQAAIEAWRKLGLGMDVPRKPEDPHWDVWLEFNRQRFRDYVRNYTDRLHKERPGLQVASNWLYSTYVPEKPDLPVDFLSGDYLGNASLTRARLDARYLAQTGKPWDLMAWGFQVSTTQPPGHIHKPAIQLQQEAAVVLAQGGGFQIYYQPSRAGRIDDRHINTMAEVAAFCRARQARCHKSQSLSDVAVLFSRTSLYRKSNKLFGGWGKLIAPCTGLLDAIVESHRSVDVQPDWAPITAPTLVIPEWEEIGDQMAAAVITRLRDGLNVFITGAANAKKFSSLIGYQLAGPAATVPAWIPDASLFGIASGLWQDIEPGSGKVIAHRYPIFDSSRDARPAAILWTLGKGRVVVAPGPIGEVFDGTHTPALRHFVSDCLNALVPAQVELADRTAPVEVVMRKQGEATVLHFLNHVNKQVASNFPAIDSIPNLPSQRVKVRLAVAPKKILWEPDGRAIGFEFSDGTLTFDTPPIQLHDMAVLL
jgi:hypothetical protein